MKRKQARHTEQSAAREGQRVKSGPVREGQRVKQSGPAREGQRAKQSGPVREGQRAKQSGPVREGQRVKQSGPARKSSGGGSRAAASEGIYAKNEVVTASVVGLTHDGNGVARTEQGYTLFVPFALPGEVIEAKVLKSKKQYGYGKMHTLQTASEHRVEPPCPIYEKCGGCQLQHYSYEAQLQWKRQHVIDSLTRIGKLKVKGEPARVSGSEQEAVAGERESEQHEVVVHPTIGMSEPWYYRNKAALPIGAAEDGQLIGGFYAKGSHRIIDMDVCLIQKRPNDDVLAIVKEIARELRIEPYDEESASGVLRHVMTRVGVVTGEVMVVLITNTSRLPRQAEWIEQLRKRIPDLKSIVHNVNNKVTNAIFGERTEVLWGSEVIYDELDGLRFAISARSFYQVNPEQTVTLYRKAVEYAALTGSEQVIDAYCGIGTISLFLACQAAHVYGVEIVPEAIEDAKRNAALNGLDNTTFEAGPAEVVIPRWKQEGMNADVIVVDPPRKGCDPALLETILAIKPQRVVYVSCNPATLARDLRVLEDGGYRTVEVTPVDMFPQTGHVECCVLLVKNK
ncbi:23S rRNA (uracil-C(5))-methyltransferase RlmCD [Paenibacillus montaniterrae]|uniref:23S rRNA (Uracil-C(5))-methyltransferase RlmCD n=1 Tax=Paenibacillus montaniterrae TaxID=429341 RepID=A0A920CZL6_9BACL|nr:23S rRNA (uracil(1939)-C(5))-methyltransferase RlmD [Paenibacillus montaniterrae]GIP18996.1 23S rRNA (uracil-C(5))-methyltransferase RlmCD [Paenibacillus montaniterrae]